MTIEVDCIIPVYNEEHIASLIDEIYSASVGKYQIYLTVVDDGSSTPVTEIIQPNDRLQIIRHPYNIGNGAAIKTGLFATQRELIVLMDGDGQHNPIYLDDLLDALERYDLVIASRDGWTNCGTQRAWGNTLYCHLASWLLGREVCDITSGFRAFKRSLFYKVFPLFPDGFSSPITLAMFAYIMNRPVGYFPITLRHRSGTSKIRIIRDGLRLVHRILKIGMLANPLKFFYAIAAILAVTGLTYTAFISFNIGRLYIPNGATIMFILAGMSLVISHIVDFAKIILMLVLCDEMPSSVSERNRP